MDLKGQERQRFLTLLHRSVITAKACSANFLFRPVTTTFVLGDKSEQRRYQKMYSKRSLIFFRMDRRANKNRMVGRDNGRSVGRKVTSGRAQNCNS